LLGTVGRLTQLRAAERVRSDIASALAILPDRDQRRSALEALHDGLDSLFSLPALELNTRLRNSGLRILCENGDIISVGVV
jgi:hypothetical protein